MRFVAPKANAAFCDSSNEPVASSFEKPYGV